jgi:hypothetical protein
MSKQTNPTPQVRLDEDVVEFLRVEHEKQTILTGMKTSFCAFVNGFLRRSFQQKELAPRND